MPPSRKVVVVEMSGVESEWPILALPLESMYIEATRVVAKGDTALIGTARDASIDRRETSHEIPTKTPRASSIHTLIESVLDQGGCQRCGRQDGGTICLKILREFARGFHRRVFALVISKLTV